MAAGRTDALISTYSINYRAAKTNSILQVISAVYLAGSISKGLPVVQLFFYFWRG